MPLKISLKPGERVAINGAVITNGDRRSSFVVQNKANILRERDIIQVEDANTPARRIYFPIMMMYLDVDGYQAYYDEFRGRMDEFMAAIQNPEILSTCLTIDKDVVSREFYRALKACRDLIAYEEKVLHA